MYFYRLLIKSNQEKFYVNIDIHNSRDNAYNTKVTLSHTENINYVKVEVGFVICNVARKTFRWKKSVKAQIHSKWGKGH